VHLLDVTGDAVAAGPFAGGDEDAPHAVERLAGAVVERFLPAPHDALAAAEVALLADGLAQRRVELGGVDDGKAVLRGPDVQLPRAVTALAADGVTLKDRLPVGVQRVGVGVGVVAVAEQAPRHDRPLEQVGGRRILEPGGQVPAVLAGEPCDGGLGQSALVLDQVRGRVGAGTDGVADDGLGFGDDPAAGVERDLVVNRVVTPPLDPELRSECVKRLIERGQGRRAERPAHRVSAVRVGDIDVAGGAHVVADVADIRGCVEVRRRSDGSPCYRNGGDGGGPRPQGEPGEQGDTDNAHGDGHRIRGVSGHEEPPSSRGV
jgi:hypothetical protein